MSAFSRGCLSKSRLLSRPAQSSSTLQFRTHQPRQPRHFTSTQFLHALKRKPVAKNIPKTNPTPTPPKDKGPPSTPKSLDYSPKNDYTNYAQTLAKLPHATPLYTAPSHTLYRGTCYTSGIFFMLYAGYAMSVYLTPNDGLPVWVPYLFGGAGMVFGGIGTKALLGASRIIKSITAVPKRILVANKSVGEEKLNKIGRVGLEVELRKTIPNPFFPPRRFYIAPSEFKIPNPLSPPLNPEQRRELREFEAEIREERRKQKEKYDQANVLSRGSTKMSMTMFTLFHNTKRAWTRYGFVGVKVAGETCQLDVTGGWALEDGKALDRLVVVENKRA
ncbi:hypothetical protein BJ875DRAFT_76049 [Amylocarpus encephaloides]|uniref:Uncharacterized protein n=1 Tax=Amylocarpus encephaloides TaxID=45428 RepID=A0A9P7YS17_9HELO|nr:hypothetical protein BJ875DRAFT_76049 [Amylocarpus encephaloides]